MIGSTLGKRYRIERLIGEGGMGAVFEAVQVDTGRRVAVKVISTADLSRTAEIKARFAREATAAAAIETRHIVQVLESGTDEDSGLPFMAMELLTGEDLQHVLERVGALPEQLALRIAAQACVGLQRAHDTGVVHRDVKPANLFLAESPIKTRGAEIVVKVLDFGIAKVKMDELGNTAAGLTRTGNMLGTPLYMSPEQAKGLRTIDQRTDIWSLGAVLYQVVSGVPPHDEETVGQLIIAICAEPPKPVQEVAPWVSPELAAILHRSLRLDPAERYQHATEMLADLSALLGDSWSVLPEMIVPLPASHRSNVARRVVVSDRRAASSRDSMEEAGIASTTVMRTTGGIARRLSESLPPKLRRFKPIFVGAIVGAACAAGIATWMSFRTGSAAPTSPPAPPPTASEAALPSKPESPPTSSPETADTGAPGSARRAVRLAVPGASKVVSGGRDLPLADGSVELAGALGSTHTVRVFAGERHVERVIVITENGAFPDRVEVGKKVGPTASGPRAAGAPSAAPRASSTGTPSHATKFE